MITLTLGLDFGCNEANPSDDWSSNTSGPVLFPIQEVKGVITSIK